MDIQKNNLYLPSLIEYLKNIYNNNGKIGIQKTKFNIFKTLSNPYDEVNLHSKFLYTILNDNEYGQKFLFEFLKYIGIQTHENILIKEIDKEKIINYRKKGKNKKIRILDLYLHFKINDKKEYIIIIENKIFAKDQYKQLDDCINYFNKPHYNNIYKKFIYLTLYGDKPSKDSCEDSSKIDCLSYKKEIINWIDDCIKIAEPRLKEVLIQYKELLIEITEKEEISAMKFNNLLSKSYSNYIITNYNKTDFNKAKSKLQYNFWKNLEKKLEYKLINNYKFTIENIQKYQNLKDPNLKYSRKLITDFYDDKKPHKYYGLIYNLGCVDEIGNLFLKVEMYDNGEIYYGLRKKICLIKRDTKKYETLLDILSEHQYITIDKKWWIGRKVLLNNNYEPINMKDISYILSPELIVSSKFSKLIDGCVTKILYLVEIVENLKNTQNNLSVP